MSRALRSMAATFEPAGRAVSQDHAGIWGRTPDLPSGSRVQKLTRASARALAADVQSEQGLLRMADNVSESGKAPPASLAQDIFLLRFGGFGTGPIAACNRKNC